MPSNRKAEVELFTEAIKLPTEERTSFLARACAGNQELRRRIEKLLRNHDRAGDFMEASVIGSINELRTKISAGEQPGDWIGRYKLLQQIGEGGCGIVFVAEQEQPVRRRVALKLIKPGMDTKSVIARFEAERQALALMDHPGIARVFDAGATENGRPYFIMELVDGVKITDYCDQHALPTSHRLELFVQVCLAIQHAHQKGVVHRDIKPSNVLVTTGPDGKPVSKVIDFGIAKAIDGQRLTENTILTGAELLIGTPAYMSPEQAALQTTVVDTRTDIYSLGVLLYELLTGTTPFDTQELLKAGLDELRRVIREQEPVRPSTRLSAMVAAVRADFARHHGSEAPGLVREMRGDLDWIVMKALEKDPKRRYATANGLAMDIQRYLSGEVVLARQPSAGYKLRKLVARNKLLFAGVTLIFVLLTLSLITTVRWLMIETRTREQIHKQAEMARFESQGWEFYFQAKYPEAEQMFTKALAMRRQFPKLELASALLSGVVLATLEKEQRMDKARSFVTEYVDPAFLKHTEYRQLLEYTVANLARGGRWNDADALAEELRNAAPDNSLSYHMLAPLLVAENDAAGYRRICEQIISRFRNATNPFVADQMAKDCLILPDSGVDLKAAAALADVAITKGSNWDAAPYFTCCKALAEFRLGHYEDAAKWAQSAAQGQFPHAQAEAEAIIAMSHFKLNRLDQARAALAQCNKLIDEKLPKLEQGDVGGDWRDWIIAHALQSEAKQMINGESSSTVRRP